MHLLRIRESVTGTTTLQEGGSVKPIKMVIPYSAAMDDLINALMAQPVPVSIIPARLNDARLAGMHVTDDELDKVMFLGPYWCDYGDLIMGLSPRVLRYGLPDFKKMRAEARKHLNYMAYTFEGIPLSDAILFRNKFCTELTPATLSAMSLGSLQMGDWIPKPDYVKELSCPFTNTPVAINT